jgi:hypothetical protein
MDICHSPESGTPGAPLRPKSSTPRSGFVQPWRCTEWRPRGGLGQIGRYWGAAIGELDVSRNFCSRLQLI